MKNKVEKTNNKNLNNRNSKKRIVIIVSIIVLILLVGCITVVMNNKKEKPVGETGHFYGQPSSVEDIDIIEIMYNNGNDHVSIHAGRHKDNKIYYYSFGKDGNISGENEVDTDTTDIIKYIYENDLKYLKEYNEVKNAKWSLQINGPGKQCLISGKKAEPKWFKELLKKLNVDKNGYLSSEK